MCLTKDPCFVHSDSKDSDQTELVPMLIRVFLLRTVALLVISCRGPIALHWLRFYLDEKFC